MTVAVTRPNARQIPEEKKLPCVVEVDGEVRRCILVWMRDDSYAGLLQRFHADILAGSLRREWNGPRTDEGLRKPDEHHKISVETYALQPTDAERRESVMVLQVAEGPLDSSTATVEVAEALSVTGDTRKEPPAESKRQRWLVGPGTTKRDNGVAVPRFALGVDPSVVVALVHSTRLRLEAASVERIEKRGDELGFVVPRRLNLPRERQARFGADRELKLVAVEAATFTGTDGAAVPPRSVGVTEPLALRASLADVALTIRKGRKVGGINRYVPSKIRVLPPERNGTRINASVERWMVLAELGGEAVHGPTTRGCHRERFSGPDAPRSERQPTSTSAG